jgi:hypothetical protein
MRVQVTAAKDTPMNFGYQRFNAAIQNFGEPRIIRHFRNRHASITQGFGGTARGQDFRPLRHKGPGQIKQTGFVGYGNKGATDRKRRLAHGWTFRTAKNVMRLISQHAAQRQPAGTKKMDTA